MGAKMPYRYETTVKLYDTDAAGIMFFANYFRAGHDAYQAYLESCGFSFARVLDEGKLLIPIVHAEADYFQPLVVGDRLTIILTCTTISTHSFVLNFELQRADKSVAGSVRTAHAMIDRASNEKLPLPPLLRKALEKIYVEKS